jgi:hypothetical protein
VIRDRSGRREPPLLEAPTRNAWRGAAAGQPAASAWAGGNTRWDCYGSVRRSATRIRSRLKRPDVGGNQLRVEIRVGLGRAAPCLEVHVHGAKSLDIPAPAQVRRDQNVTAQINLRPERAAHRMRVFAQELQPQRVFVPFARRWVLKQSVTIGALMCKRRKSLNSTCIASSAQRRSIEGPPRAKPSITGKLLESAFKLLQTPI